MHVEEGLHDSLKACGVPKIYRIIDREGASLINFHLVSGGYYGNQYPWFAQFMIQLQPSPNFTVSRLVTRFHDAYKLRIDDEPNPLKPYFLKLHPHK